MMEEFKQVRANLIDMLEDLDHRLGKITDDVKHLEPPVFKGFSEQAVETENDQILNALENQTGSDIEKIKLAVSRIDSGTYGLCSICGQFIKKDRLSAIPFSSQCISCAERNDV